MTDNKPYPESWADAVNLARNICDGAHEVGIPTRKGTFLLARAIMDMDAMRAAEPAVAQAAPAAVAGPTKERLIELAEQNNVGYVQQGRLLNGLIEDGDLTDAVQTFARAVLSEFGSVPTTQTPAVTGPSGIYVASRASLPEHPARWRALRTAGWPIVSTWIDEAGPDETADLGELWTRIMQEVSSARGLVLYVGSDDFPLKGALIEVGAALALGKRVGLYAPGVLLEERSMRPLGSWAAHPLVRICPTLGAAREWAESTPAAPTTQAAPQPAAQRGQPVTWEAFHAAVDEYIDDYEMLGETEGGADACYTPNENDKALLLDAFMGFDFSPWVGLGAQPQVAAPSQDVAIKALRKAKSDLMHQRRFGMDTLGHWRNAACSVEGDIEEALNAIDAARAQAKEETP